MLRRNLSSAITLALPDRAAEDTLSEQLPVRGGMANLGRRKIKAVGAFQCGQSKSAQLNSTYRPVQDLHLSRHPPSREDRRRMAQQDVN